MRNSEQITVGALAIKEVIRKQRMAFWVQSQGSALLTAERAINPVLLDIGII
jgi:hypothetical protein